ncbi:type II secretion system protein [Serratia ficaria]|uniref:type II secretion system protein n=1 Tax=Serratia ficaria TaxID=61651 RepID=UPI0021BD4327|nr:type II secretion system protein [Serratia ficaria]
MVAGKRQGGFTYLFVLLALTLIAGMLLKSREIAQIHHRQEQEEELLFRGEQIRKAISRYQKAPYANGCYPDRLEQLLEDRRGSQVHHHLRRWFSDPLTGNPQWGMNVDPQGRWIGVHSLGSGRPLRKSGFNAQVDVHKFKKAESYSEWVFAVKPDANAPHPSVCKSNNKSYH